MSRWVVGSLAGVRLPFPDQVGWPLAGVRLPFPDQVGWPLAGVRRFILPGSQLRWGARRASGCHFLTASKQGYLLLFRFPSPR